MKRGSWIALVAALFLPLGAFANDELLALQKDDKQWVMAGKNYSANRYSSLAQVTTVNVKQLKEAWSFSTGSLRGHEGAPLVVGSTMYVHSSFSDSESSPGPHIYALDLAKEGAPIKWTYTPRTDKRAVPVACCDVVQRGLNFAAGKILFATLDGQVIALDAGTGKEVWKIKNANPQNGETMTMAGLVVKDKYIVGVSGGEFGIRGWVAAYNVSDGKQAWKAYSMGPDEDVKIRSEKHTSELQSPYDLVCRLLLEKKKKMKKRIHISKKKKKTKTHTTKITKT